MTLLNALRVAGRWVRRHLAGLLYGMTVVAVGVWMIIFEASHEEPSFAGLWLLLLTSPLSLVSLLAASFLLPPGFPFNLGLIACGLQAVGLDRLFSLLRRSRSTRRDWLDQYAEEAGPEPSQPSDNERVELQKLLRQGLRRRSSEFQITGVKVRSFL